MFPASFGKPSFGVSDVPYIDLKSPIQAGPFISFPGPRAGLALYITDPYIIGLAAEFSERSTQNAGNLLPANPIE